MLHTSYALTVASSVHSMLSTLNARRESPNVEPGMEAERRDRILALLDKAKKDLDELIDKQTGLLPDQADPV